MYGDGALSWDTCDSKVNFFNSDKNKDGEVYPAVCLVGDRFYKGNFLPASEIEKSFSSMDGAYHDLNHWSTSYGVFGTETNIEYIVGYQDDTKYDADSKKMTTNIHIVDSAPKSKVWHGFMDICKLAGRVPNVSVTFWADRKTMSVKDLPKGVDYKTYGLSEDDTFDALVNLEFHALATVFRGACDDKSGCGIGIEYEATGNTVVISYDKDPENYYIVDVTSADEIEKLKKAILVEKIKMEELSNGKDN